MSARDDGRAAVSRALRAHLSLGPFVAAAWACSVAYEVLLGRRLPPGGYGAFETLIGVLAVPGVVATAAQLLVARAAVADGSAPALGRAWRATLVAACTVALSLAALAPALTGWLRLPAGLVVGGAAVAGVWTVLGGLRGAVQGAERYVVLGASFVVENGGRLVGTYALVRLGERGLAGAYAALAALALGGIAASLALVGPVLVGSRRHPRPLATAAGVRVRIAPAVPSVPPAFDLGLYAAGAALVAFLPALPVLVLRPALPTRLFAALAGMALLGRGEAQVGGWLSQALYPRLLAATSADGARAVFAATVALGASLATLAAAAAAAAMPALIAVVFAGRYAAEIGAFRLFVFCALPLGLYGLWVTDALARRDAAALLLLAAAVPLELAALFALRGAGLAPALAAEAAPAIVLALYAHRRRRTPSFAA